MGSGFLTFLNRNLYYRVQVGGLGLPNWILWVHYGRLLCVPKADLREEIRFVHPGFGVGKSSDAIYSFQFQLAGTDLLDADI
jgi:hypothetical protein